MKLKYYLRGLGVGILFSTIILSFSFNAALKEKTNDIKSNSNNTEEENSDEEIDDLEDLLIPTVEPTKEPSAGPTEEPEKNEEITDPSKEVPSVTPTKFPTDEQTDETTTSSENPAATPSITPSVTALEDSSNNAVEVDKTEEPNKSNEDKKQVTEETDKEVDKEVVSKEKDSQDYIIINIQKGMYSEEVALILKNYGIIENYKDFNNFLKDNDYSTNIKVGDFKLSKNATYEQIANLIVEK